MEFYIRQNRAARFGAFLTTIPKWAAYAIIAWQIRLSIEALSGKNAGAALLTRFERQTTSWELICWVAGVGGVVYGLYNRILLRRSNRRKEAD
jgi:hypothetical protein